MSENNEIKKNKEIIPVFVSQPSMLSSENTDYKSYRGFVNLIILLLIITNLRLIFENALKYGLLITPEKLHRLFLRGDFTSWPSVSCVLSLNVFVIVGYLCEVLHSRKQISHLLIYIIQILNILMMLLIPSVLVWFLRPSPGPGVVAMLFICSYQMKLWSYAYMNYLYRIKRLPSRYPEHICLRDLYLFIFRPTLTYQHEYPQSPPVRWGWLLRRLFELFVLASLVLGIEEQYIAPLVANSLRPMEHKDYSRIVERILKLAIPNLYVWLIGFYIIFHLWLNIWAEVTHFGDRLFYKDWWNSTDLGYFWRSWNLPVHQWMKCHILSPLIEMGSGKLPAILAVFFLSAVYHELLVAVPLQNMTGLAFWGMMAQLPLIWLSMQIPASWKQFGNVIFWISIALGQPFIVLLTYRDFYRDNYTEDFQNIVIHNMSPHHHHHQVSPYYIDFTPIIDFFQ